MARLQAKAVRADGTRVVVRLPKKQRIWISAEDGRSVLLCLRIRAAIKAHAPDATISGFKAAIHAAGLGAACKNMHTGFQIVL